MVFLAHKIVEAIAAGHQRPKLNREGSDPGFSVIKPVAENKNAAHPDECAAINKIEVVNALY
jgi:hypothetical protein